MGTFKYNVEVRIHSSRNSSAPISVLTLLQKTLEEAYGKENVQSYPVPPSNEFVVDFFVNVPEVKKVEPIVLKKRSE